MQNTAYSICKGKHSLNLLNREYDWFEMLDYLAGGFDHSVAQVDVDFEREPGLESDHHYH